MVSIMALWLPILLSAVIVFIASSIIHMALTYHRADIRKLPNEARVSDAIRADNPAPGLYMFPWCESMKAMGTPEMVEKFKRGPVALLTVLRSGPPTMTKNLIQWFVFSLVVGVFVAYVAGHALAPGAEYLRVFQIAGTVAFLGYAGAQAVQSIWGGIPWGNTVRATIDGLIYGLLTAGVFGWLWPGM